MAAKDNLNQLQLFPTGPSTASPAPSAAPSPAPSDTSDRERLTEGYFHYTGVHPEEFMRAPTIHMGTVGSAVSRSRFFGGVKPGGIYALSGKNLEIDDMMLSDQEANLADVMFLKHHDFPIPRSVTDSVDIDEMDGPSRARAARGFQSLMQNRAITYENFSEGGISVLAPSPQFNMHLMNAGNPLTPGQAVTTEHRVERSEVSRDNLVDLAYKEGKPIYSGRKLHEDNPVSERFTTPGAQPVLPMDWSTVDVSETTRKNHRM